MTAILQLPLVQVAFETGSNEDWRDAVAFATAGQVTGHAVPGNVGTGALAALAVQSGAYIGDYVVTLTSPTAYRITDPDGYEVGAGLLGVPFQRSGLSFILNAGGTAFVAGDALVATVLPTPIDITGIAFRAQVRGSLDRATIDLDVSTAGNTMVNGGASGVMGFAVPWPLMARVPPGDLLVDVLAMADGVTRRCLTGTINHVPGVTRLTA